MPTGIDLSKKNFQTCLENITVFIPQWNQAGFLVEKNIIVSAIPPDMNFTDRTNVIVNLLDKKYNCNIELVDQTYGCIFLSVSELLSNIEDYLLPTCNNICDIEPSTNACLSYYIDRNLYEALVLPISGMRSARNFFDKTQYIKLGPTIVSMNMIGAPVWSFSSKNIIGIVNNMNFNSDSNNYDSLWVTPSVILQESLYNLTEESKQSFELVATEVTMENLDRIFVMSEIAYEEANPYNVNYVKSDLLQQQLAKINNNRRIALTRWFSARNDCLRFIVEKSSGITHRVGLTCVLPLTKESYEEYRNGIKREFDISLEDIDGSSNSTGVYYLCFQSFVYAGKNLRNVSNILKEAIVSHVLSLTVPLNEVFCIAEIGTKAGNHISNLFKNGKTIGFSADRRPLVEWHFKKSELNELITSLNIANNHFLYIERED